MALQLDNTGRPVNMKKGDLLEFGDSPLSKVASYRLRRWQVARIFRSSVDGIVYCRLTNCDFLTITKLIAITELKSERFDIVEPQPVTEAAPPIRKVRRFA